MTFKVIAAGKPLPRNQANQANQVFVHVENLPCQLTFTFNTTSTPAVLESIESTTPYSILDKTSGKYKGLEDLHTGKNVSDLPSNNMRPIHSFLLNPTPPSQILRARCVDAALRISNDYLKSIMDPANEAIYFTFSDGKITVYEFYYEEDDPIIDDSLTGDASVDSIFAHQEEEIGEITISEPRDSGDETSDIDLLWLNEIEIKDSRYRRKGIGTELIRLAIDTMGLNCISCEKYIPGVTVSEFSLTSYGEVLIAACIKKGIVTGNMCHFVDPSSTIGSLLGGDDYDGAKDDEEYSADFASP